MPDARPNSGRHLVEALLVGVLVLLPIWIPGPIPTHDGPQHAFAGYLINHLDDAGRFFDRYLERQFSFSALGFPYVTAAFETFMPIRVAVKATLSVLVLLQAFGFRRVLSVAGGRPSPWRWLAPLVPFGPLFYFGMHNYAFGVAAGLWTLSVLLDILARQRDGRPVDKRLWGVLSALLVATALAHAFVAALWGLVAGVVVLVGSAPTKRLRALGGLFIASVPTLVCLAAVASSAGTRQESGFLAVLTLDLGALLALPRQLFETPYETLWAASVAPAVALLVAVVASTRRENRLARGVVAGLLVLLTLMALLPDEIAAWHKLHVRFGPWVLVLTAAAASTMAVRERWRPVLSVAVAGLTVVSLFQVTLANLRLAEIQVEFEGAIGASDTIPQRRLFLAPDPNTSSAPGRHLATHLHVYYMMDEGGMFKRVFRNEPEQHVIRETAHWHELVPSSPPQFDTFPPEIRWQALARVALDFDDVLLWDPPHELIDAFGDYGHPLLAQHGGIWRFQPANRELTVTFEEAVSRPTSIVVMLPPLLWPVREGLVSGDRLTLTDLPAAEVQVGILTEGPNETWVPDRQTVVDLRDADGVVRAE